jgi:hypothetical protein
MTAIYASEMENISKQAFDKETSDKELPFSQHASY